MNIHEDIKRIVKSLLEISSTDKEVVVTIYSSNFTSRYPHAIYYQNLYSVQKMIEDEALKFIKQGEDGQPVPNAGVIHYFTNYTVSFNRDNLIAYLDRVQHLIKEQKPKQSIKEVYRWNGLTLDLDKFTLQYKDKPPIDISLTREIRLLRLLMRKPRNIVYYLEIAKEVGIDIGDEQVNPGSLNKSVALDVQKVKQDLIDNFLIPSGMPEKEARSIIVNVRYSGYKLG